MLMAKPAYLTRPTRQSRTYVGIVKAGMRYDVPKPVVLLIGTRRSSHDTLKSNINIVQDRGRFMSHADKESWMEQPEVQYVNWGFEPAYLRRLYTPESVLN